MFNTILEILGNFADMFGVVGGIAGGSAWLSQWLKKSPFSNKL